MPWFKVDDGFHGHPKVMDLSLPAVGLWTLAGSWCAKYLTDGTIGMKAIVRLGATESDAMELVRAGLWIQGDDGDFHFNDWDKYQPLKAEVEAERDAARDRMKNVRAKKKGTSSGSSPERAEDVRPNTTGTFAGSSEEVRVTPSHPIPSRPDTPIGVSTPETARGKNGTRIPAHFKPTPTMIRWAQDNAPNVDWATSTRKFSAHYRSAAGAAQFKTDWTAAWESWLIGDQQKTRAAAKPSTSDKMRDTISRAAALQARHDEQAQLQIGARP